jgi:hypothetical protein
MGLTRLPEKIWDRSEYVGEGDALLSPDGTEVVVPIYQPFRPGPVYKPCKSCAAGIEMYSVTTGVTTKWLLAKGDKNVFTPVNWPGYGHEVLLAGGPGYHDRLLDVARPGGSLLASSRPIPAPGDGTLTRTIRQGFIGYGGDALLLPGDQAILRSYARISAGRSGRSTETARILETSATTGRLLRMITLSARVPSNAGIGCIAESVGPTQLHVLMFCLNRFGRLDGNKFTPLPGPSKLVSGLAAAW